MCFIPIQNQVGPSHRHILLSRAGAKIFNEFKTKLPNTLKRIIATSIATVNSTLSKKWLFKSNYHCKVRIKRTPEQLEKERRAALSVWVLFSKKKSCQFLYLSLFSCWKYSLEMCASEKEGVCLAGIHLLSQVS